MVGMIVTMGGEAYLYRGLRMGRSRERRDFSPPRHGEHSGNEKERLEGDDTL